MLEYNFIYWIYCWEGVYTWALCFIHVYLQNKYSLSQTLDIYGIQREKEKEKKRKRYIETERVIKR